MDSKRSMATFALFITLNLLLFTQAISTSEKTCFSVPNSPRSVNTTDQQSSNWENNTTSGLGQSGSSCPIDTLKLGACVYLLEGIVDISVGHVPDDQQHCCTLIQGLADLEAALCLCTAIKANILGIYLNLPVSLSLLLNACSKEVPSDEFQCA